MISKCLHIVSYDSSECLLPEKGAQEERVDLFAAGSVDDQSRTRRHCLVQKIRTVELQSFDSNGQLLLVLQEEQHSNAFVHFSINLRVY